MFRSILLAGTAAIMLAQGVAAQQGDVVYIQIEAQPSLNEAEARLRDYAGGLRDVNGFSLGGGWYGIALGPYDPEDAAEQLRNLRAAGLIPRDSYLAAAGEYGRQFWPVGAGISGSRRCSSSRSSLARSRASASSGPQGCVSIFVLRGCRPGRTPSDEPGSQARQMLLLCSNLLWAVARLVWGRARAAFRCVCASPQTTH